MYTLLYLHGFGSSPESEKAQLLAKWMEEHCPNVTLLMPTLSDIPREVAAQLESLVLSQRGEKMGIIGSSMGGFYATWLSQCFSIPAVLMNPAVRPAELLEQHVTESDIQARGEDKTQLIEDLQVMTLPELEAVDLLWLIVQTGDEVLDYRQAVDYYALCRQTIDYGGNHSFVGFEHYLPDIIKFLDLPCHNAL